MSSIPQYGPTATAPPYLPQPQPHLQQPSTPGAHRYNPAAAPSVHYHPASQQNGFDSVDLESAPCSPHPTVNRPIPSQLHQLQLAHANNNNTDYSVPNKKSRFYRRCGLLTVAFLIIVLVAVGVGLTVFFAGTRREPVPGTRFQTNCVSCTVLERAMADSNGRMPVNVAELDMTTSEDGKLLCCLKVSKKTDAILEMLLEHARQTGPPVHKAQVQNRTRSPPTTVHEAASRVHHRNQAAALVGLERKLPVMDDEELYVLKEWGHSSSTALYIRPDIHYNTVNGHFTVPHDGLYNVNVHVSLFNYGPDMKMFGQRLLRFNRHSPAMGNEKLAYDMENIPSGEKRTSSLALTVHLQKNDELFLQVSPAGVVVDDSSMSFFCIVFESA